MKTIKRKGIDGKEIIIYIPENEEDVRILNERARMGEVDDREALNDPFRGRPARRGS
jgi:hypothetical protein